MFQTFPRRRSLVRHGPRHRRPSAQPAPVPWAGTRGAGRHVCFKRLRTGHGCSRPPCLCQPGPWSVWAPGLLASLQPTLQLSVSRGQVPGQHVQTYLDPSLLSSRGLGPCPPGRSPRAGPAVSSDSLHWGCQPGLPQTHPSPCPRGSPRQTSACVQGRESRPRGARRCPCVRGCHPAPSGSAGLSPSGVRTGGFRCPPVGVPTRASTCLFEKHPVRRRWPAISPRTPTLTAQAGQLLTLPGHSEVSVLVSPEGQEAPPICCPPHPGLPDLCTLRVRPCGPHSAQVIQALPSAGPRGLSACVHTHVGTRAYTLLCAHTGTYNTRAFS